MAFTFNLSTPETNTNSYLKAYNIYDNVAIKSTEIKEGTSAAGKDWKSLNITFGNDEGIYNHSIFYINIKKGSADLERREFNGRQLASAAEQTLRTMQAIAKAFMPEYIDKLNEVIAKCGDNFDKIMNAYKTILDKVVDKTTTSMKLVGRNRDGVVYATLPSCIGIAQANTQEKADRNGVELNEWYTWMVSPFGKNLAFTPYELKQKNEMNNAKPTAMPDVPSFDTTSNEDDDLDDLLAGL